MDAVVAITNIIVLAVISDARVTPQVCSANFRWEDCGREPLPVMYYWKPGSRCEVGIWRGCLPSLNMFKDEYECVSTCIFSVRAEPADYHNQNDITGFLDFYTTDLVDNYTGSDNTSTVDNTEATTELDGQATSDTNSEGSNSTNVDNTDIANDGTATMGIDDDSTDDGSVTTDGTDNNPNESGTTNADDSLSTGDEPTEGS